ncbi:MAG: hypothetical protein ACYS8Z_14850 [Planctomycetota bacterium]|jgi:hypothetical protein
MKRHLTEQELIEYRFDLASDAQAKEVSGHLNSCEHCRAELEMLKRRFELLDLLHDDVTASEDLIQRAIEQASRPSVMALYNIPKNLPAWAGAAAAVLIVALIWMANIQQGPSEPGEGISGTPLQKTSDTSDKGVHVVKAPSGNDGTGLSERTVAGIPEKPPFAPASAIELVTLPRRDKVQLTIYNSADLTLVRERRNLTMKKGWNWLQFMWANTLIDPTSLSLVPQEQGDKIEIQQLVFPARLRELGRWLIRSEVSGQVPFEITYFTSGLSWRAFYMGTLAPDEKSMQMKGYVRLANASGEEYEEAQTRLLVGKVHLLDKIAELAKRKYAYGSPALAPGETVSSYWSHDRDKIFVDFSANGILDGEAITLQFEDALRRPKEIKKEGLSEYFLYTIEGTETIPDKWGKRLLSFEAEDIEVESLYKYDEERWGNQTIRFVTFANDEDHNLGDTPIPNGQVRIYGRADDNGSLSYVGGTSVKYIPVDEEVELNLGGARLVKVEPKLMDFKTANYQFDRRRNISGWDEIRTWDIEIANTRKLPIEIEITRGFGTPAWTLETEAENVNYSKHDATHARFELKLEPATKRTVGYTVTTYHGVRQEVITAGNREE